MCCTACRYINKSERTSEIYHYSDVIMGAMTPQNTSLTIVCSTVYSGADQRKHQSSASLAFVRGIHRWPLTQKKLLFDDVIMFAHSDGNKRLIKSSYIFVYASRMQQWYVHGCACRQRNIHILLHFPVNVSITCQVLKNSMNSQDYVAGMQNYLS